MCLSLPQFFADVKESQEQMRKMQENMKKKYSCDRATTATRLEDLLQDAAVGLLIAPRLFMIIRFFKKSLYKSLYKCNAIN